MKVFENFDLTNYNSYKVKSSCSKAFFPENEEDILDFFSNQKDYYLIGSGHNLILSKNHFDKPFIIFNGNIFIFII